MPTSEPVRSISGASAVTVISSRIASSGASVTRTEVAVLMRTRTSVTSLGVNPSSAAESV